MPDIAAQQRMTTGQFIAARQPGQLSSLAFLPIPVLFLLIIALLGVETTVSYEHPYLLIGLNLVFSTPVSLFIAWQIGRSFAIQPRPGLLLIGCGVLLWGAAGVATAAACLPVSSSGLFDANLLISIHNCCVWMSAICHLTGVAVTLGANEPLRRQRIWLAAGYCGALMIAVFIMAAALAGWFPPFFIPGQGGTLVRQFVLGSAITMFVLTAILMRLMNRRHRYSFACWYGNALLLLALGLFGVLFQKVNGSILSWVGRGTQYLGGVYMLILSIKSLREPLAGGVVLERIVTEVRQKIAIAVAIAFASSFLAAAIRLVLMQTLGLSVPYVTFFPAVMLAAVFGGSWSGVSATLLSAGIVLYYWIEPVGELSARDHDDWLGVALFIVNGLMISLIVKAWHGTQSRALKAEAEARYSVERELSNRSLQMVQDRYRLLVENMLEGYAHCEMLYENGQPTDFICLEVNKSFERLTGLKDVLGRKVSELIPGIRAAEPEMFEAYDRVIRTGQPEKRELCVKLLNIWLAIDIYTPEPGHFIAVFDNITDRKQAEIRQQQLAEQLQAEIDERKIAQKDLFIKQAQLEKANRTLAARIKETVDELRRNDEIMISQGRQAAMGEMIGNIAHQWRQPLNSIGLIIQYLQRTCQSDIMSADDLDKEFADALGIIMHMSKTIDDFRNFFQPSNAMQPFSVSRAVTQSLEFSAACLKQYRIGIDLQSVDEVCISGYQNEFSQVVLNLLNNARDQLLEQKIAEPRITIRIFSLEGHSVTTIHDNGGGIAENIIEQVFDPYFTTKAQGKGTGIGLFMCKSIIEKHMGGSLTVRNVDGGAEFRIEV